MTLRAVFLAIADLLHSWVLSFCIVLALSAALAPVLILHGLKNGVVQTMREELASDPLNREVSPFIVLPAKHELDKKWFGQTATRSDVEWIIPTMTPSPWVYLSRMNGGQIQDDPIDLMPTGAGDPLLVENGARPPQNLEEVALSAPLAASLGVSVGDSVRMEVRRGPKDKQTLVLKVSGVAELRAMGKPVAWVLLDLMDDIETFKRGGSVQRLSWLGDSSRTNVTFKTAVSVTSGPVPETQDIINGTGFTQRTDLPPQGFNMMTGLIPPAHFKMIRWETGGTSLRRNELETLGSRLTAKKLPSVILPWPAPPAEFGTTSDGRQWRLRVGDDSVLQAIAVGNLEQAWESGRKLLSAKSSYPIRLAAGMGCEHEDFATEMVMVVQGKEIKIPVTLTVSWNLPEGDILLDPTLAAQLTAVIKGEARMDAETGVIVPSLDKFDKFRCYAKSLADVESLTQHFQSEFGVEMRSSLRDVVRIQTLDRHLSNLFVLIASVTAGAAFLGFAASIYAWIRRRQRAMAHLRLLGFSPLNLMVFPCVQALILASSAVGLAYGVFRLFEFILRTRYSLELQTEAICRLRADEMWIVAAVTCGFAMVTALMAGIGTVRTDPARHLRED
jgi:putative ABC transport system permease protein